MCRNYGDNLAFFVELNLINAYFTVSTRTIMTFYVVFVDTVIDDIPFVPAGNLQDAVVGGAVYLIIGVLDKYHRVSGNVDRSCRRG